MQLKRSGKSFVLVLLLATITSCESSPSSQTDPATQTIGTSGALISIQSDNVMAAGYDESSQIMTVQFRNGAVYEYYGIPGELWTSFFDAQPHPWREVGYPRLVGGGVPYKRIR
jgi:hypothetical protein